MIPLTPTASNALQLRVLEKGYEALWHSALKSKLGAGEIT